MVFGLQRALQRRTAQFVEAVVAADILDLEQATVDAINRERKSRGLVLLVEDLTETQTLEDKLVHSERLASIGRLAAGVAHEIGNPLTAIASLAVRPLLTCLSLRMYMPSTVGSPWRRGLSGWELTHLTPAEPGA